jgi:circadian clock protein KaiB
MRAKKPARKTVHSDGARRAAPRTKGGKRYVLKLYVAGVNRQSAEAITAVTRFCDERLEGRYQLSIIDIYQAPALVRAEQVIAVPMLVRERPLPVKTLIGHLADPVALLAGRDGRQRP